MACLSKLRIWGLAAMPLALFACAQPQSNFPTLNANDVKAERVVHQDMVRGQGGGASPVDVARQQRHITRLQRVAPKVKNAAVPLCQDMGIAMQQCNFSFAILDKGPENAYADGGKIFISPAMIDAMDEDRELAFVLAHEYAHNLMGHVGSMQQNIGLGAIAGMILDYHLGTQGQLSQLGSQFAQMRYSKGFEQEADYVGMYILARAGYDIGNVAQVWREASLRNPNAIYMATTHPTNPERFLALNQTAAEIQGKKATGARLVPDMKRR